VLLDLPVEEALGRLPRIRDRVEARSLDYHVRVREGFLELSRLFPDLFRVVSGAGGAEDVERRIHAAVSDLL